MLSRLLPPKQLLSLNMHASTIYLILDMNFERISRSLITSRIRGFIFHESVPTVAFCFENVINHVYFNASAVLSVGVYVIFVHTINQFRAHSTNQHLMKLFFFIIIQSKRSSYQNFT